RGRGETAAVLKCKAAGGVVDGKVIQDAEYAGATQELGAGPIQQDIGIVGDDIGRAGQAQRAVGEDLVAAAAQCGSGDVGTDALARDGAAVDGLDDPVVTPAGAVERDGRAGHIGGDG